MSDKEQYLNKEYVLNFIVAVVKERPSKEQAQNFVDNFFKAEIVDKVKPLKVEIIEKKEPQIVLYAFDEGWAIMPYIKFKVVN